MLVPFADRRVAWLLLRTKPKREHNGVQVLHHRVLEAYCPHVLQVRRYARAPVDPVPLFPSHGFARCEVRSRHTASYCPGIFGAVRFGEFLATVDNSSVDLLRSREGELGYLPAREVRKPPARGQEGPLADRAVHGVRRIGGEIHAGQGPAPAVTDGGRWGAASRAGGPPHPLRVAVGL